MACLRAVSLLLRNRASQVPGDRGATDDISIATGLLAFPIDHPAAYDVVIYFAHRIPSGAGGSADQEAFVAQLQNFLIAGGGVVSFHHGSYLTPGKESIQEIIGVTATGSVPWNTADGQNVINVAPTSFITSHEVEYPSSTVYADPGNGIASDTYGVFNNTPDERYIDFTVNPTAGTLTVLFASDYNQNGTTHILGFEHTRPEWAGVVIGYQPGEYQPNALDDLDANNFQILANAIVYAAYVEAQPLPVSSPISSFALTLGLLLAACLQLRLRSAAGA